MGGERDSRGSTAKDSGGSPGGDELAVLDANAGDVGGNVDATDWGRGKCARRSH